MTQLALRETSEELGAALNGLKGGDPFLLEQDGKAVAAVITL